MVKGVIGIDPGKGGGMAISHSDSTIDLRPWTVEHEHIDYFRGLEPRDYVVVIEDVPSFVSAATSNASSFKLGYNYGFIVGAVRSLGFSTHLVSPKEWQKGLSGLKSNMGYTARKRMLKDNAIRLYPDLNITNKTADAVLVMDWGKKWKV